MSSSLPASIFGWAKWAKRLATASTAARLIGAPIKRAAVLAVAKRFAHFAQPNIDAGKELDIEIAGTLLPSQVARVAAERWRDAAWCAATGAELRALYQHQAGAAERMAAALLEPVAL